MDVIQRTSNTQHQLLRSSCVVGFLVTHHNNTASLHRAWAQRCALSCSELHLAWVFKVWASTAWTETSEDRPSPSAEREMDSQPLGYCPAEFSVMREIFYICTAQHGHHKVWLLST